MRGQIWPHFSCNSPLLFWLLLKSLVNNSTWHTRPSWLTRTRFGTSCAHKSHTNHIQVPLFEKTSRQFHNELICTYSKASHSNNSGSWKIPCYGSTIWPNWKLYFSCNSLAMNPTKSSLLVFRNHKSNTKLKIMGIDEQKTSKFLGIWFDSQYTFVCCLEDVKKIL